MDLLVAMKAFVHVTDAGSFSAAAKQLRLGQPAVSKLIAQLEERLGARLLQRSTHGLAPTEAGQNFYYGARRSLEEVDKAELATRTAASGLSGRLRICAGVSFARIHVIPVLLSFMVQHPALDVDIVLDDRYIDLVESGIDIGLLVGRLKNSTLFAQKIGQCQRRVVGTPSYFEGAGTPLIPADLVRHQVILHHQPNGGARWTFRQGTERRAVTVGGRIWVNTAEGVRDCVLANLGLAVASEWMFAPELKANKVRPVLADWSLPPLDVWAVFPTGRQTCAKARAFADFIKNQMSGRDPAQSIERIVSSRSEC